ncbi:hypothetical protein [Spirosoma arcticum]
MLTKAIALSLLAATLLISCKKSDEVVALNPDLTIGLTGTYPLTYYREGPIFSNLPTNGVSGQIDVTKVDLTHIEVKLTMTEAGVSQLYSTNDFELSRDSGNPDQYTVSTAGKNVGIISPTYIDVSTSSPDGTVTQVKAKR